MYIYIQRERAIVGKIERRKRYRAKDERESIQYKERREHNLEKIGRETLERKERENEFYVIPIEIEDYHAKVYPSFVIHAI